MTLEIDSDFGTSLIVATASSSFDLQADKPTIVIAWNSSHPLPFTVAPHQNITYFDLKHGLSSLTLSRLASCLRERFEARGYTFSHFDETPLTISEILRRVRRKMSYRLRKSD